MELLTDRERELNNLIVAEMKELLSLKNELRNDLAPCWEQLAKDKDLTPEQQQFWRRATVRIVFAAIEGQVYFLKRVSPTQAELYGVILSRGELALLHDEAYEIDENGKVKVREARISFGKNARFVLDLFGRSCDSGYKPDYGGRGWQYVQKAIKVRDRLMHPKSADALHVTRDEAADALEASTWFEKAMGELVNDSSERTEKLRVERERKVRGLSR